MKTRNTALVAIAAMVLGACTTEAAFSPPPMPAGPPPPPPPPSTASIVGHGAYQTRGGARGDCQGLSIALMHDTPAFHARIQALYGSDTSARVNIATVKARSAKLGQVQAPLAASVTCDGAGNFAFKDVDPGAYFVIARLKVTLPSGTPEDLVVLRHVDLAPGETRNLSLAP